LTVLPGVSANFAALLTNTGFVDIGEGAQLNFSVAPELLDGEIHLTNGEINFLNDSLVVEGGSITGNGLISTPNLIIVNGVLSPGNSPGVLSIAGDLTLGTGSVLDIELAGANPADIDQILVSGVANLGGLLNVDILDGYEPDPTTIHPVIAASSFAGDFANENIDPVFELTSNLQPAGLELLVAPFTPVLVPDSVDPSPLPAAPQAPDPVEPIPDMPIVDQPEPPEVPMVPEDVINDVVVINNNSDEQPLATAVASNQSEEEEEEERKQAEATQCR